MPDAEKATGRAMAQLTRREFLKAAGTVGAGLFLPILLKFHNAALASESITKSALSVPEAAEAAKELMKIKYERTPDGFVKAYGEASKVLGKKFGVKVGGIKAPPVNWYSANLFVPLSNGGLANEVEVKSDPRLLALGKAFGVGKVENEEDAGRVVELVRALVEEMPMDDYVARAGADPTSQKPFTSETIIGKGYGKCLEKGVLLANFLASYGVPSHIIVSGAVSYYTKYDDKGFVSVDINGGADGVIKHALAFAEIGGKYFMFDASDMLKDEATGRYSADGVYSSPKADKKAVNDMVTAAYFPYLKSYIHQVPGEIKLMGLELFKLPRKEDLPQEVWEHYSRKEWELMNDAYKRHVLGSEAARTAAEIQKACENTMRRMKEGIMPEKPEVVKAYCAESEKSAMELLMHGAAKLTIGLQKTREMEPAEKLRL